MGFLGRALIHAAGFAHASYLDRLYSEIAVGDPNYSYAILSMMEMGVLGVICGYEVARFVWRLMPRSVQLTPHRVETRMRIASVALLLIAVPWVLLSVVDGYIRLKTSSSFHQHLAILTPYTPQKDIRLLRSRYAAMRTRADYEALMNDMAKLAESNHITLPQNKLYPF